MPVYNLYQIVAKDVRGVEVDKCYIGCTRSPLHKRFYQHKKNRSATSRFLFQEFGAENCSIRLLRSVECTPEEATFYERQLIEEYRDRAVNVRIPGRTPQEVYETNKEQVLQQMKEYYQENRLRIKARCLLYYHENKAVVREKVHRLVQCPDCDKTMKYMSLSYHRKVACQAKHPSSHTSEPQPPSDPSPLLSPPVPSEQE